MLFNIEYCIIDLSDYDIKRGKTQKTVRSQDLPGYWIVIYQNMTLQRHEMVL